MTGALAIRGGASREEIAAVTAVITAARGRTTPPEDAYERWRRTRLAALRTSALTTR